MLLVTLGSSLLGNMWASKWINRAGEGCMKTDYGSKRSSIKDF